MKTPVGGTTESFAMSALTEPEIYKLLIGAVVPRPIAWVSCMASSGVGNIAPFSYFNAVSSYPPMLGFSVAAPKVAGKPVKDTLAIIRDTGDFVVNLATVDLLDQLVLTSIEFDAGVDEFEVAGLTPVDSVAVKAPRIGEAPVSFECVLHIVVDLGTSAWVIGEVVHAHFRKGILDERLKTDVGRLRPIGRMPGPRFCTEMNVVTRAVELLDPAAQQDSELSWLSG